ncbi:membrane protein [Clostridium gelidum]|uniref:Membrane protein n=1 Tax=Clostridium gelidum TaxID=704125 RepID=A0ABM7T275_9CLOT|nr:PrsW family intramembrane metalloprotease [Clostridium gelidum]BCZ45266.1 membrane protein [Clostridium gelidum]
MDENIKDCPNCKEKVLNNSSFCSTCGFNFNDNKNNAEKDGSNENEENGFINKVNIMDGGSEQVDLRLTDLLVNVFKKHSLEERENTFICGTGNTAPKECDICSKWPKPWLYSRVFFLFAATFLGLLALLRIFKNVLAYPGIIFIGALTVPFSLLVFFWELNAPRNINIFDVTKIFFFGGVSSLLLTMIFSRIIFVGKVDYFGAIMIGVIEESAKFIVVAYFLRGSKRKFILNGLLLGAAVGAGFAVFETAGYEFAYGLQIPILMRIIYTRGVLAFGGHIVWAAMAGAALVMVKEDNRLKIKHIMNIKFLKYFVLIIGLHAIWDMPISTNSELPLVQVILTITAWIIVIIFISAGLKQISSLNHGRKQV